jgi:hypothetical protein
MEGEEEKKAVRTGETGSASTVNQNGMDQSVTGFRHTVFRLVSSLSSLNYQYACFMAKGLWN